jgi:hypothetical protein
MPALFEITGFNVKVRKVIASPAKCKGSWRVSETYTSNSATKLAAHDKVPCKEN